MERPPDERPQRETGEAGGDPTPAGPQSPMGPQSPAPAPESEQRTEQLPAPVPPAHAQPAQYGQGPYQQPPYYQGGQYQQPVYQPAYAPQPKPNGFAIASLVLGILWVYWIGSILALIFGYVGKNQIDSSNGMQSGRGMAIAGIVLGWVGVGFLLAFILFFGGIAGCGAVLSS